MVEVSRRNKDLASSCWITRLCMYGKRGFKTGLPGSSDGSAQLIHTDAQPDERGS